ncbi:MAG: amino acid adenylation domain-containing protein [Rhodocyclaceae bacterium]|nr:amino acid adenylation domain-containing protein [Rhodocyclaceae bacterium]
MTDFLIHSPVAHYARVTPQQAALSFAGHEMSYAALDAASNRLAHALISSGLKRQGRVGIFMHKALSLGVAIYGILKAGGVFVPLDPFMPVERLGFILDDCEIGHLVSADGMAGALKQLEPTRPLTVFGVGVETGLASVSWSQIDAEPASAPDVWLIDQDLGYIMYTSGSTGNPKGMMHSHLGSITYARWGRSHVGLTAGDRVASHAPLHFDLSIFDFFSTAQAGATVVLVPEQVTKFPASWTQYIESERISVVFTVPFTLIEMMQRGAIEQRDLSSLRWILFGGEPYPPKHLRALMAALPNARFTNVYGPAEAPSCTCYDVPPLADDDDQPIPIGTVSCNSDDLILDDDDGECADGEAGELCIRSSTLTRGYWKRPDLNQRVFFERPSYGHFPDIYFRTGDYVVRHPDGLLRYLGRKDRMVKTRGHRVELDEVEAALASHPAVSEAAAFVVPDAHGSKQIHACVTLCDGARADAAVLMRHARTKIPAYALPRHLDVADDLPRTSSGKIDRRQLAATNAGQPAHGTES